jgi:hypothetical protein
MESGRRAGAPWEGSYLASSVVCGECFCGGCSSGRLQNSIWAGLPLTPIWLPGLDFCQWAKNGFPSFSREGRGCEPGRKCHRLQRSNLERMKFWPHWLWCPRCSASRRAAVGQHTDTAQSKISGPPELWGLVTSHNQSFPANWINGHAPEGDEILGDPDPASLINLGRSFHVVQQMEVVLINRSPLIILIACAALPMVPLIVW